MDCGSCNVKNVAGAKFCSSCGETLAEPTAKSEAEKQEFSVRQWIIIIVIALTIGAGYGWLEDKTSVQQARQVPERIFLSELALICETAEQIPQFLTDLENNRLPNLNDCAMNPTKEEILVDIIDKRLIGQDMLVQWRIPSNGFQAWTLESNLITKGTDGPFGVHTPEETQVRSIADSSLSFIERVARKLEQSSNPTCRGFANTLRNSNPGAEELILRSAEKYGCGI